MAKYFKLRKRIVIYKPLRPSQFSSLIEHHFTQDLEEFKLLQNTSIAERAVSMSIKKDKLWKICIQSDKIKTLALTSCSLTAVSLKDFPSSLTHLCVRGSEIYPEPFFGPNPNIFLPHLTCLDIGGVSNFIQSQDVHVFTTLKSLRCLYMEGCFRINNGGIESILELLPQLEILDVEGTDISNEGAVIILNHSTNIRELFIGHTQVDDAVFLTVGRNAMPHLTSFCVMDTNITSMGLHSFLLHCLTAQKLAVRANFAVISNFKNRISAWNTCLEITPIVSVVDHTVPYQGNKCRHHLSHKCRS